MFVRHVNDGPEVIRRRQGIKKEEMEGGKEGRYNEQWRRGRRKGREGGGREERKKRKAKKDAKAKSKGGYA